MAVLLSEIWERDLTKGFMGDFGNAYVRNASHNWHRGPLTQKYFADDALQLLLLVCFPGSNRVTLLSSSWSLCRHRWEIRPPPLKFAVAWMSPRPRRWTARLLWLFVPPSKSWVRAWMSCVPGLSFPVTITAPIIWQLLSAAFRDDDFSALQSASQPLDKLGTRRKLTALRCLREIRQFVTEIKFAVIVKFSVQCELALCVSCWALCFSLNNAFWSLQCQCQPRAPVRCPRAAPWCTLPPVIWQFEHRTLLLRLSPTSFESMER